MRTDVYREHLSLEQHRQILLPLQSLPLKAVICCPQTKCRALLSFPSVHIPLPLYRTSHVHKLLGMPGTPLSWGPCHMPVTLEHHGMGCNGGGHAGMPLLAIAHQRQSTPRHNPVQDEREASFHVSRNASKLVTGGQQPMTCFITLVAQKY